MEKLKSRKLIIAVVTAILTILEDNLGLNIPKEAIYTVIAYIVAQGWVDGRQ
jgi:hypothetical protein